MQGCDAIEEFEDSILASFQLETWPQDEVSDFLEKYQDQIQSFEIKEVERENWNESWEQNFDPVEVGNRCIIRAPFHEVEKGFDHEIVIMPKMSFGTGHHATTYQMVDLQLSLDHVGKKVLDLGTGTGVLAILAKKLGAAYVEATDIDDWCIENTNENVALNSLEPINVKQGPVDQLTFDLRFDIVIANINKNVLLAEMSHYANLMNENGSLLLSGFYEHDILDVVAQAEKCGLKHIRSTMREQWAALDLNRPS